MAHWLSAWRYADRAPEVLACVRRDTRPLATTAQYLRLRPFTPHRLTLRSGAALDVETYEDLATAWVVFFRREYAVPADATTVLDLGANIGTFTLLVASERPAARIVSVEPFPSTFARLTATVALNRIEKRVQAWPFGVAARTGERVIPAAAGAPSQSLGMVAEGSEAARAPGGTTIEVLSLDELIAKACETLKVETIDFAKIDVEGAEHESLRAVSAASLQRIARLGMEYHPNDSKAGLFAALTEKGFVLEHDRAINAGSGIAHFRRVDA